MFYSSNVVGLIAADSTSDVSSTFIDVSIQSIPTDSTSYQGRDGLKFFSQYGKYTITFANPIQATNWLCGILALVVVKEKVVKGLVNYDGTNVKINELFVNNDPYRPTMFSQQVNRFKIYTKIKHINGPSLATVDHGLDEIGKRMATYYKKIKVNKEILIRNSVSPDYRYPKTYMALMYFPQPWSAVKGDSALLPKWSYSAKWYFKDK